MSRVVPWIRLEANFAIKNYTTIYPLFCPTDFLFSIMGLKKGTRMGKKQRRLRRTGVEIFYWLGQDRNCAKSNYTLQLCEYKYQNPLCDQYLNKQQVLIDVEGDIPNSQTLIKFKKHSKKTLNIYIITCVIFNYFKLTLLNSSLTIVRVNLDEHKINSTIVLI